MKNLSYNQRLISCKYNRENMGPQVVPWNLNVRNYWIYSKHRLTLIFKVHAGRKDKNKTSWGRAVPSSGKSLLASIWDCLPKKLFEVVFQVQILSSRLKYFLPSFNIWGCLPFTKNIWGRFPFTKRFVVVFHLQKCLRLSSIYKNSWGCLPFTKISEVVFHLQY